MKGDQEYVQPSRLEDYLDHIRVAIERCHRYVDDMDEGGFLADEKTQDAVIHTIEVIGEASISIIKRYPEVARRYPRIPLGIAYEMRNAVAHGYFKVDLNTVWRTVQHDLPELSRDVIALLENLDATN